MLSYLDELVDVAKLPLAELKSATTISLVNSQILLVNNYIKILTYSDTYVALKIKNNELIIEGSNIQIKELNKHDILLQGYFNKLYFAKEVKPNEAK
ncbi:MAG: YabP/YqfC family sporulation protein [Clostridia bacterium]|nr:YabP/YqfC family sporulation protein [Clostridia bacterium]